MTEPLVTARLLLRQWRDEDLTPYTELNADPRVTEFFPAPFTPEQSLEQVIRFSADLDAGRPGVFAVERREQGDFIGFIGLNVPRFEAAFTPCVEVGWRLAPHMWRQGLASEGARAALAHGFTTLGLDEIVSFTSRLNLPSQAVMRTIGMTHDPAGDFEHPNLPDGHPLRPHVLYRVSSDTAAKPGERV
ncbi:MAG: GNAT family N-acetyltransferase [Nocardioidaceae bacterium]|nr:GNAT family N-acetyltransferase [Nocardioidaceae bacterium]